MSNSQNKNSSSARQASLSPAMARAIRHIHRIDPNMAKRIREQIMLAQKANKELRSLLARHRIQQRRLAMQSGQLLAFPKAGEIQKDRKVS